MPGFCNLTFIHGLSFFGCPSFPFSFHFYFVISQTKARSVWAPFPEIFRFCHFFFIFIGGKSSCDLESQPIRIQPSITLFFYRRSLSRPLFPHTNKSWHLPFSLLFHFSPLSHSLILRCVPLNATHSRVSTVSCQKLKLKKPS